MNKEIISESQSISLIVIFIIGTSSILVTGMEAKKDIWLATIIAVICAILISTIYAKIHTMFPDKDLFDIVYMCFGIYIGSVINILFIIFSFILAILILRDFGEFSRIIAASETPMLVPMVFVTFLGIWIAKEGVEVIARLGKFFLVFIIGMILLYEGLSIPNINLDNIRPILYDGMTPVLQGAFESFAFPFAEVIIFTMFFSNFRSSKSPYKVYSLGLVLAGLIILLTSTMNILVLGVNRASVLYFPSYSSVGRINVGDFFQRLEVSVSFIFFIGGFVKYSVCFLVLCKGISKVFKFDDYRPLVTPIGLLCLISAFIMFDNIMDFVEFSTGVYSYFALPYQIIFPIMILIVAKLKIRNSQGSVK